MQPALQTLFYRHFGVEPEHILSLKGDGSDRRVFRLTANDISVIGVFGANAAENEAFVSFSRHFAAHGLPVPEILSYNAAQGVYLETDFGDQTLFDWLRSVRALPNFVALRSSMYRKVLEYLPRFQIQAGRTIDFNRCYQTRSFEAEAMLRDLLYFRHTFLRRFVRRPFDDNALLQDFYHLINRLLEEQAGFFLYRDLQSRNIMIQNNAPHFIDYQSGRLGALEYDPASLLYDANVELTEDLREELLPAYLEAVNRFVRMPCTHFKQYFYDFALIRVLQALAAFCFLSFEKGKIHLAQNIPYGFANLNLLMDKSRAFQRMNTLRRIVSDELESVTKLSKDETPCAGIL